jgi:hypothetical protein
MGAAAIPAAIGLQVGGSLLSAEAGKTASLAQEGYYRTLANNAENNAMLAEVAGERQATNVRDAAAATYAQHLRGSKKLTGAQRAAAGAAGISGSVTAEDIARDTANTASLDEMAIRFNADSAADEVLRNAGLTALNLRAEADGYRMSGAEAKRAGKINYATTLIGGATSVASTAALAGRKRN